MSAQMSCTVLGVLYVLSGCVPGPLQGEDQTALDRMGEIGSYKRLLALRKTIAKSPQAKATKLLGRTWAANVFPKVREHMEASTAGYDEETVELRKAFLDGFALEMGACVFCRLIKARIHSFFAEGKKLHVIHGRSQPDNHDRLLHAAP